MEMTASRRRRPSSPAAELPPLENPDLLDKILLRLPPLPSSLPRASAVCKRWRGLVSDPRFVRRFRAHHRRSPPLLGFFSEDYRNMAFQPILEPPNRVPQGRFPFPIDAGDRFLPLGCRHGLMLILHSSRKQLLVWDPITGDHHCLDIPAVFDAETPFSAAVLRAAGEAHHFQVVLVGNSDIQLVASVYSSETGVWGNFITEPFPPGYPTYINFHFREIYQDMPSVMVGDSLYWLFSWNRVLAIIEFDLVRQSLALIPLPVDERMCDSNMWVVPAESGCLGFLFLTGFSAQLWKRKKDSDGVTSWVPGRSIQLDKPLSLNPKTERSCPHIVGFAEENNVVLLGISRIIFTIQLESLQLKKLSIPDEGWLSFYPYEVVYTADKGIDGGHDGAELLQNT